MSDSPAIIQRANQMLAMLTPEEKDKAVRKASWPEGVTPTVLYLTLQLARLEKAKGTRTAKAALPKALAAIGQSLSA